jgi:hypothetical protein
MPRTGRPKVAIDLKLAEELGRLHCTLEECSAVLGVKQSTLSMRKDFLEIYKRGLSNGKSSLRRMQWKSAMAGNVTMQIWLGKQLLKQRDQLEHSGEITGPGLADIIRGAAQDG